MFVLFLFLNLICAITSHCPIGWLNGGTYCYHLSPEKLTWGASQEYCWSLGGHLAEFSNREEENAIEAFLIDGDYWIGLTDIGQEGSWKWEESQQVPAYTNWNGNEPNGNNREKCAMKGTYCDWRWMDLDCLVDLDTNIPVHALCQMEKETYSAVSQHLAQ